MFECLYCGKTMDPKHSSLEHAVPQFLGGAAAPARFHLKNVCATCNNRLGLFVDASYAKAWFTTNALADAARLLCTSENDPGLPPTYLGHAKIQGLIVPPDYVAEHWLGPFGETIIWVRYHDERMDAYAGGNPIDARRVSSTAYFVPTMSDGPKLRMAFKSFDRMVEKKKVRKILCAKVLDASGVQVRAALDGFELPNASEQLAVAAILQQINSRTMRGTSSINVEFDRRFICKLALGVGFALFGEAFLSQPTTDELRRGVWPERIEPKPMIPGSPTFSSPKDNVAALTYYPGTVVLIAMRAGDHWSLTLTVDSLLSFTVSMGPASMIGGQINSNEGYALILMPYLEQAVELTGAELIAHRLAVKLHPDLVSIEQRRINAAAFWAQLNP